MLQEAGSLRDTLDNNKAVRAIEAAEAVKEMLIKIV